VAREFKRRKIPLSVIVIDFFHWTQQGDWKFDPELWPDPESMVAELRSMGIEPMVSIWPTVDSNSENYDEMRSRGFLVRNDRADFQYTFMGNETYCDVTNPGGRTFIWDKAKQNYYDHGIHMFWLDEAEPELGVNRSFYNFDNTRYYAGPALKVGNIYPFEYAKAFYEGMKGEGQEEVLNLIRCAWAGSQRFGTLLWSGDVHSTFESFAEQVRAGLNAGVSGIPWWTSDIGGFSGGNAEDPEFRELLCRWYEWAVFCPVTRAHGFRRPVSFEVEDAWRMANQPFGSGAPNEPWSYGEDAYQIITSCIELRERLRPYVSAQMEIAQREGLPPMRPLFFDFPAHEDSWVIDDEYLFGADLLVAPIMEYGQRERTVVLPAGTTWVDVWTGESFAGGQSITAAAPVNQIPVFGRAGSEVLSQGWGF
jgi:alpha-D-xyloside xylohydrolase